jgi:uncharacterized protein
MNYGVFYRTGLVISISLLCLNCLGESSLPCHRSSIVLGFDDYSACVEVAEDEESLIQGLMFRSELAQDSGMLFIFPYADTFGMWMKNTPVPLSVAFADEHGRVINVEEMQAYSLDLHYALSPARYAIEMRSGWFTDHRIYQGQFIQGLPLFLPYKVSP